MKNNKLLALILSLMMIFSFAACDKKSDAKETTKHTTSSSTTVKAKKSSATKAASSSTAASTTAGSTTTKKATVTTTKKTAATTAATTSAVPTTSETLPAFSIKVNETAISNNDVKNIPVYKYYVEATNSSGTVLKNTYKGYKLSDILRIAGYTNYSNGISVTATDGYKNTYTKAQIDDAKTILAITKIDENGSNKNADCPIIAPCSEASAQNYAKYVSSITVN